MIRSSSLYFDQNKKFNVKKFIIKKHRNKFKKGNEDNFPL